MPGFKDVQDPLQINSLVRIVSQIAANNKSFQSSTSQLLQEIDKNLVVAIREESEDINLQRASFLLKAFAKIQSQNLKQYRSTQALYQKINDKFHECEENEIINIMRAYESFDKIQVSRQLLTKTTRIVNPSIIENAEYIEPRFLLDYLYLYSLHNGQRLINFDEFRKITEILASKIQMSSTFINNRNIDQLLQVLNISQN